jgi:hypothetical protein
VPDPSTLKVAVGDEVRVHYHPPGLRQSFAEGVVSRLEVITLRGRGFFIDITREVILGREQVVKSGYQNFVLYERPDDFPNRIEMLSQAEQTGDEQTGEPTPEEEQPPVPEPQPSIDQATEENRSVESEPDYEERKPSRGLGDVISAVFGRRT